MNAGNRTKARYELCYNLPMQKIFFLIFVLFPTLGWAQPSIEFQTEKHDFGTVNQGVQLEYKFEFTNNGSDELFISEINTS